MVQIVQSVALLEFVGSNFIHTPNMHKFYL